MIPIRSKQLITSILHEMQDYSRQRRAEGLPPDPSRTKAAERLLEEGLKAIRKRRASSGLSKRAARVR